MKRTLLLPIIILVHLSSQSQYLAAFNDYLDHFWVFEAGMFTQVEHLAIQEYQVGGILVAYLDGSGKLKVYRNGETKTLMDGNPIKFTATDYLLGYSLYDQLNVYDNGKIKILSTECNGYVVKDSLIAWNNKIKRTLQVYYNGRIITLIDGLLYFPLESYMVGDNTIAFVNSSTEEFYIFYLGKLQLIASFVEDIIYQAGRDIVAYMDIPKQSFNVFYRGEVTELDVFQPRSFQVGDEVMAYVDNLGKLKFFEHGEVTTISSYEPQFYTVEDKVLVFEEQGFFKTVCNGQVYIIERYIPQPYRIDFNTIAYLDQNSFVKVFQNCETVTISYEKVKEIDLIRDLVIYVLGINKTKIYFNGTVYEY